MNRRKSATLRQRRNEFTRPTIRCGAPLPRPDWRDVVHVPAAVNLRVDYLDGCPDWVRTSLPVAQK
jgi:hypothetical protein